MTASAERKPPDRPHPPVAALGDRPVCRHRLGARDHHRQHLRAGEERVTTPNVALLRLTLKHIEMAPCTWDQREWRVKSPGCGTTMCFAGWACTLAGGRWYSPADDLQRNWLAAEDEDDRNDLFAFTDGLVIAARWRARRVLGLDSDQAFALFDASNSLSDLHKLVDEICAGVES